MNNQGSCNHSWAVERRAGAAVWTFTSGATRDMKHYAATDEGIASEESN